MSNSASNGEKKETTPDSLFPKRKVDEHLWKQVMVQANGSEIDKLNAIDTLFKNHYNLPEESTDLLKKLSKADEPQVLRLKIANNLTEKENEKIPYSLYSGLIEILRNDPSSEVKAIAEKLYKEKLERLNDLFKICTDANRRIFYNLQSLNSPLEAIQRQWLEFAKAMRKVTIPRIDIPSAGLIQLAETQKQLNSFLSKQLLQMSLNYFPSHELQVVKESLPVDKQSRASILKQKLEACLPSDDKNTSKKKTIFDNNWRLYQAACRDILSYTIVPPLLGPLEEARTASTGGTQRRDLIFNIPHEVVGFWQWASIVHSSLSIVVECKNYGKPLRQNQVVITSKYLGKKRLGNLGIILTRKELSKGAIAEQKRLWLEDDKLILCLCDQDLIKMLELKEHKEEPSKVIDDAIRSFRQSLA